MRQRRRGWGWTVAGTAALLLGMGVTACGIRPASPAPDDEGQVISGERLRATQATDALDALELAGTMLHIHTGADGVHIGMRGPGSVYLSSDCLVLLDQAPLSDASYLSSVPVQSVKRIRVLQPHQAALRYGTMGGNGALIVETSARSAAQNP